MRTTILGILAALLVAPPDGADEAVLTPLERDGLVEGRVTSAVTEDLVTTCQVTVVRVFFGNISPGDTFTVYMGNVADNGNGDLFRWPTLHPSDGGIFPIHSVERVGWIASPWLLPSAPKSDATAFAEARQASEAIGELMRQSADRRLDSLKRLVQSDESPVSEWAIALAGRVMREGAHSDELKDWLLRTSKTHVFKPATAAALDRLLASECAAQWRQSLDRMTLLRRSLSGRLDERKLEQVCSHIARSSDVQSESFITDAQMLDLLNDVLFVHPKDEKVNRASLASHAATPARELNVFLPLLVRGAADTTQSLDFRLRMAETIGAVPKLDAEQIKILTRKAAQEQTPEIKRALMKVVAEHTPTSPAT